jgi:hypothetical protein
MHIQPLPALEELPRLLRNIDRIQVRILRRDNALNTHKPNMHTTVIEGAVEAPYHVALRRLNQGQRKELRRGVPGEVAVGH